MAARKSTAVSVGGFFMPAGRRSTRVFADASATGGPDLAAADRWTLTAFI
jgi:hypothetical protein